MGTILSSQNDVTASDIIKKALGEIGALEADDVKYIWSGIYTTIN